MAAVAGAPSPIVEALASTQRFVLRAVDWPTYRTVSDALAERHLRFAFDRGSLEFMTISRLHGRHRRLLGRFVTTLSEELGLPISSGGDFTLNREDLDRASNRMSVTTSRASLGSVTGRRLTRPRTRLPIWRSRST
jgi:hypothetical protein